MTQATTLGSVNLLPAPDRQSAQSRRQMPSTATGWLALNVVLASHSASLARVKSACDLAVQLARSTLRPCEAPSEEGDDGSPRRGAAPNARGFIYAAFSANAFVLASQMRPRNSVASEQ